MSAAFHSAERYFAQRFDIAETPQNYAPFLLEILKALHWRGDAKSLRDALPYSANKAQLGRTDFLNVLAMLGYAPKVIKVHARKITAEMCPCLFVPKDKVAQGQVFLEPAEIKGAAHGTLYIFTDDHENEAEDILPNKTVAASGRPWFFRLLYRFKGVFGQVLLASFFVNILALVTPLFMMGVYDKVIGSHSSETLKFLLAGAILAVGVEFFLRFLRSKSLSWFGARIDYIVSNAIFDKLLSLPASYTERASVAAQLSRLKAFESVREFFTGPLFLAFVELPFTLILLAAIWMIGGPLVMIPLLVAFFYGLILIASHGRLRATTARMATASALRQNMNIETLGKQEVLRSAGLFDAWLGRYEKTSAEASYAGYLYAQAIGIVDTLSQALVVLGGAAMIYFGVDRIWAGEMSMGALIAVLILTWRTLAPLQMACTALPRFEQVKRNITQINRLMALAPERKRAAIADKAPQFKGEIEFHNVGLRYSKDADPVYAGLSFHVRPGQLVAIVGANSTGKSTTLKLLSGLYDPQAGSVRIDGVDIRQIDPVKLRQNVAYVGQEPEVFSMSLEDNLRLVKPDASFEEIGRALKQAGLHDWLQELPDGLATPIGHGASVNIPTAMLPQIALARAYLQDSPIMLIDEMPYEFLNTDAGRRFFDYLKGQKEAKGKNGGGRTILYTTYRQDYIDLADKIVQLYEDGRPQIKENAHE